MQKPATLQIDLMQGATWRLGLVYKNRLKKPYDLTGFRAHMQIRETASGALVHDLSTENEGIVLSAVPGGIDLHIPDEATAVMNFAGALYDLFLHAPNGDRIPVIAGKVTLAKGQTRDDQPG